MKWTSFLALGAASTFVLVVNSGCQKAVAQTTTSAKEGSTDRKIELLVYSQNFAMIRETRPVELSDGRTKIGLQGVSNTLDQNSVVFSWPDKNPAKVVSSTYDVGMNDAGKLLTRFLGQEVTLVYRSQSGRVGDRVKGRLEIAEPGNIVVRTNDSFIVNPDATIEAPSNAGVVAIPQLSAVVETKQAGKSRMGLAYMTEGLSWQADYTATLDPKVDEMGLECWASVTNRTGTDFPEASLKFVAGSPNRAARGDRYAQSSWGTTLGDNNDSVSFQYGAPASKRLARNAGFLPTMAVGELHAYPYKATATIRDGQTNRVRMMGSEKVIVKRTYSIGLPYIASYGTYSDPNRRIQATMGINVVNDAKSGMGEPLPGGAIRVYEPDKDGSPQYIGAATIGDTPKDARISLTLTDVFDLYATVKNVSSKKVAKNTIQRVYEIKLANEKDRSVTAKVVQPMYGKWKIVSETEKSVKLDASTCQWSVTLKPGEEKTLRVVVNVS